MVEEKKNKTEIEKEGNRILSIPFSYSQHPNIDWQQYLKF